MTPRFDESPETPLWIIVLAASILVLGLVASSMGQIADPHRYAVEVETALPEGYLSPRSSPVSGWLQAGVLDAVHVGRPCVHGDPGEPTYSLTHCDRVRLSTRKSGEEFLRRVSEFYRYRNVRLVELISMPVYAPVERKAR